MSAATKLMFDILNALIEKNVNDKVNYDDYIFLSFENDLTVATVESPNKTSLRNKDLEDVDTPRVMLYPSIKQGLISLRLNDNGIVPNNNTTVYIYKPVSLEKYQHKLNRDIIKDKLIYDAAVTEELWALEDIPIYIVGFIDCYNTRKHKALEVQYVPILKDRLNTELSSSGILSVFIPQYNEVKY